MKRFLSISAGLILVVAGLLVVNHLQPERLTAERLEKAKEVQKQLDGAEAAGPPAAEKEKAVEKPAADKAKADANTFKVKFETTAGDFVVEVYRDWAPIGAQHFEELVKANYYDGCGFFRVLPGFVVQFGINGDPKVTAEWDKKVLKDDPVKQSNLPGMVTYATAGPNTRTTQLFINLGANAQLNGMGFAPFAKVVEGMEAVKKINSQYGQNPDQGRITGEGNSYLKQVFPNLDYIKTARIVE